MVEAFITLLLIILFTFLFYKWFCIFFHRKYRNMKPIIPIGAYVVACILLRLVVNYCSGSYGIVSSSLSSILEIVILDIPFMILLFKGSFLKKCGVYLFTTMILPSILTALLGTVNKLIGLPDNSYVYEHNSYINFFTVHMLSYVVLLMVEETIRKRKYKTKNYFMSIIYFVIIFQFMMHYYFSYMTKISVEKTEFFNYQFIYTFCVMIFFCICIMYEKSNAIYHKTMQMNHQIEHYEYQARVYDDTVKNMKQIRKLHHDYKNHLIAIQDYINSPDTESANTYIQDLLADNKRPSYIIDTNNPAISAILTYKNEECIRNDILFRYHFEYETLNLSPTDITILFGNLLDNAIEACKTLSEHIEKKVLLDIRSDGENIAIICANPYEILPKRNGEFFHTSKSDSINHGLGLGNIQDVVEKYDGNLTISTEKEMFVVSIYINIQHIQSKTELENK